jgi:hypothetical protein
LRYAQDRVTPWVGLQRGLARLLARIRWAWARGLILRSRIFDPGGYAAAYNEVGLLGWDPVVHYLAVGGSKGLKPHLLFDPLGMLKGVSRRSKIPF